MNAQRPGIYRTKWQSAILAALRGPGRSTITDLAEKLAISDETVRRHIRPLVDDGTLERAHGAVILPRTVTEPPFSRRMEERTDAKRAIAAAVAGLIGDGETLMIDTGSTTAYVAAALLARRGLTVITNSLEIAHTLVGRNDNRVYVAGGEIRADIGAAVGPEALALIGEFHADRAILSIGAMGADGSLLDFDLAEARVARAMIRAAGETVVAADARKFGGRGRVRVCGPGNVATLVTDAPPPSPLAAHLAEAGVTVRLAGVGGGPG